MFVKISALHALSQVMFTGNARPKSGSAISNYPEKAGKVLPYPQVYSYAESLRLSTLH